MSEFFQNGGNPPVVGRKPTSSDSAAQLFLANGEWSKEDSLKSAIDLTGVSPCSVRYFEVGQDNTFHIGHVAKHDEDGFYLYTESQSHLSINGEPITGDPAKISGVLANYQFGGMTAVLNYLKSLGESGEVSSDIHCDVPALVVEPIRTSSDTIPVFLPPQEWDEEELAQKIRTMLHVDLDEVESLDFGDRCTFEAAGVEYADGKGLVLWSCKHYFLYINGEEVVVEQDMLGNVLANYEYGGSKAVNAYLDSIGESGEVSNDIRCDTPTLVVEPVPTSADTTPDLEESSDVSTSLKMQIQSEGASVVTEVVDSQVLPEAPDWQVFNFVTMLNLLSDVIDTSDISDLIDGRDGGVIQYIRCGIQSEKIQVESREELSVQFLGQKLKPMTFNAFGNFLYALKHHGEEVALSVLHRIYSGVNEE